LVYQESKFNDQVKSHSGAFGIMQLMPATAKSLGVDSSSSPHEQIRAGVSLLLKYDRFLAPYISNDKQRVPFVVAAY
ncbi:MAG TPA: transglycosylase SLT domain-containing protein, partial [Bacteroidales bacterium]|nr:transglycosylase SLT domain-containing protein [Bacteroidales bacterium]